LRALLGGAVPASTVVTAVDGSGAVLDPKVAAGWDTGG
jgi:hypothetical protein